jgi:hypothetical protein
MEMDLLDISAQQLMLDMQDRFDGRFEVADPYILLSFLDKWGRERTMRIEPYIEKEILH